MADYNYPYSVRQIMKMINNSEDKGRLIDIDQNYHVMTLRYIDFDGVQKNFIMRKPDVSLPLEKQRKIWFAHLSRKFPNIKKLVIND